MTLDVVVRARAAVGARFRLHGRDPAEGLDCVGLAAWALGVVDLPTGYGLRSGDRDAVAMMIAAAGLRRVDRAGSGDLLLAQAGPGQLHLAIWTGAGVVHADAMLRRVVERPGAVPWPVVGVWRLFVCQTSPDGEAGRHCNASISEPKEISWQP